MPTSTDCPYSIRKWACWVPQYDNWHVSTEIENKSFLWVFKFLKSINSIKSYGIFKKSANSYPRYENFFTKYANYVPNLFKYANFSTKCAHFAVKYTYFSSKYTNFAPRSANFTFKYIIFFTQICTGLEYGNATQNTDLCYVEYCYLIFEVGISA